MLRISVLAICVAGLAACDGGLPSLGGGGGASSGGATAPAARSDGEASKLSLGMTPNDAFGVFGPESGFERNPGNWDQSCLSYNYGPVEAPSYVHAIFENDILVSSTDGHPAICTFSTPDEVDAL